MMEINMTTTTNIYKNQKFIRREKALTLEEYVKMGRLEPGQYIHLAEVKADSDGRECHTNSEGFWVGDCTPYHQPSDSDGEIGWDYNVPTMKKIVLEIHTYK